MPEEPIPGILPPVHLNALDTTLYSIVIRTPSPVSDALKQFAAEEQITWERAAENALLFYRESFMTREDHARENLDWTIRNFGPPKPRQRLSRKEGERLCQTVRLELSLSRAVYRGPPCAGGANVDKPHVRRLQRGTASIAPSGAALAERSGVSLSL
jgi:hypothetical protein